MSFQSFTSTPIFNRPALRLPRTGTIGEVEIPIHITKLDSPVTQSTLNQISYGPVIETTSNTSAGGIAIGSGATQLAKVSIEGWIDTPTVGMPDSGFPAVNQTLNPSFEYDTTGNAPAQWASVQTAPTTFAVQTGWAASGSKSLRITPKSNMGLGTEQLSVWMLGGSTVGSNPHLYPIMAGQGLGLRAVWNFITNTAQGARFQIMWADKNGNTISYSSGTFVSVAGITTTTNLLTAPANTAYYQASIVCTGSNVTNNSDFFIDAIMVTSNVTSVAAYADGDTSGWRWTGIPGQSNSQFDLGQIAVDGNRYNYAEIIAAYFEGRAQSTTDVSGNTLWQRVDPLWFRDPYGRVYTSPRILTFTATRLEAVPKRNNFTMQLQVGTR